jgi:putative ABC transport system permease protein
MSPERWLYAIPLRLRSLFRSGRVESELDEELQFHLERRIEENTARGMNEGEARRQALLALRGLEQCKEACRDTHRVNLARDLAMDLGYGVRVLRKAPAFTIAAVVTIALGTAASTAMFSVTDAVLLRPLAYQNPDRLVLADTPLSNAYYFDLRNGTGAAFDGMAAVMVFRAVVPREDGTAERISKGLITTNFLPLAGARTAFGRGFTEADGKPHGAPPPPFPLPQGSVAILSYDYFQKRYGGNPAVLGRHMLGAGGAAGPQIVGVVEPGFKLLLPARISPQPSPDAWIANDRGYDEANRGGLMLHVVGTLKPGVTQARAQAQIDRVAAAWGHDGPRVHFEAWQKTLVDEVRPALVALLGAGIFLLLVACANVANLLLVRASLRERELAVRAALGARAGRLTRQMLAEVLLLCGAGTLLGTGLAWLGIRELLRLAPENLPRLETASIDWRVLAFAAVIGAVECALLGALPGWRAARPDVMRMLAGAGRTVNLGISRLVRAGVVVAAVALSFVLLIGSGLMFRSFLELRGVAPGYDSHGLLTFLTVGDAQGFQQPQRRMAFLHELEGRLRAIPGVESAGASTSLPLHPGGPPFGIAWSTKQMPEDPERTADLPTVLPGYFETLRTRVLQGRIFTEADNASRRGLAVIDQAVAAKAFPNQSAVGQRICVRIPDPEWLEVIGVVEHQRLGSLAVPGQDQIFLTDGYWGIGISRHWALRTNGDPARYAAAVRAEVAKFAPGRLAVTEMQTMDTTVEQAQAATRFHLLLIGAFAAVAALLAGGGLHGILSSVVRRRTAEIGVRMALGASPVGIFRLVIGQGLVLSAAGVAIGLAASAALTRAMASMLVGIRATDPATFAAVTLFFLAVAAVACWLPARRAARLDPVAALREE